MIKFKRVKTKIPALLLSLGLAYPSLISAEDGVNSNAIYIGGVLDLEGRSRGLGKGMKAGIEAAFKNVIVKKRRLKYIALNDSYMPKKTIQRTQELINQKVFLFAGNVGTPTAKVSLPLLRRYQIPAVGFFTGAGLLRSGQKTIINYRASYTQETTAVIRAAFRNGIKSKEVCAYVQNDAYGMAGVDGILSALRGTKGSAKNITALKKVKSLEKNNLPLNNVAPLGVYKRNSDYARPGYKSIKLWEKNHNIKCKLIITVGAYQPIAEFIAYSRYKKEPWIFSAVSFTGAENLKNALEKLDVDDNVIMTQVVPRLNSSFPIVREAKEKLGKQFGFVSLEGFIVGKLIIHGLRKMEGKVTRRNFTKALLNSRFDLGGLDLNFTSGNQGSQHIELMTLNRNKWGTDLNDSIWNRR
ncbi:MAG: ABC transporter substrate-binding protein [Cocleimonas sp.]|nr:ABC transporter substrate-binding protein [Cocleimonas sp.]